MCFSLRKRNLAVCWSAHIMLAWSWPLVVVLLLLAPWGSWESRVTDCREAGEGFKSGRDWWPPHPGVQSLGECVSCCFVQGQGFVEGPLPQGSGHILGRWEREGQEYYPQKLRNSAHSPNQAQRENPLSLLSAPIPPFPIPQKSLGF